NTWKQYRREKAFKEAVEKMVENFESQRKHLREMLDADDFLPVYFAGYIRLKGELALLEQSLDESKQRQKRFADWRTQAEAIDAEFRHVNV
ncbi:labile enterotoxin output A, partial [Salmonella enterica subsp. enterica]|nr:labile enterotoxin output A [Salmonella enterica subsp. enterica]